MNDDIDAHTGDIHAFARGPFQQVRRFSVYNQWHIQSTNTEKTSNVGYFGYLASVIV